KIAKEVLAAMFASGKTAQAIVEGKGLVQISDASAIEGLVRQVTEQFPDQVKQFRGGNEKVFGFLVGQIMKASRGKANPQLVNDLLRDALK
ncbi:MAG: Asp-tRNA(Asn)/Glu-tRNA(Gln) amidotransferase GatCAB subunit B, partial [Candidatus Hydrogenedentes bacterium]|nr:Asp-tRNA(Asn)/Glu-tRNA(Gln) amidotransferase GatCAB subunit B [Candidatus Hydrogenedentota bacterium]